jgi:hypothetical protein
LGAGGGDTGFNSMSSGDGTTGRAGGDTGTMTGGFASDLGGTTMVGPDGGGKTIPGAGLFGAALSFPLAAGVANSVRTAPLRAP